ncbi:MAG: hypothetical protein CVU92_06655 [Firmicutes bacterium HGW-Firmicutes-17]|nr:MAG: hypothetical protein CVU92_06655 [Firmicutes bacterium HGW-Firmicutes-17]
MNKNLNLAVGQNNGNGNGNSNGNGDTTKFEWADHQILDLTANNIAVVVPLPQVRVTGAQFNITALGTPAMPETNKTPATAQMPGEILFTKGYNQVNGDVNTLSAYNIMIIGNLIIDENSYLVIENCANLWVKGNIIINTNKSGILNDISATNIIVEGTIEETPNVKWTYTNFWLNGVKKTNDSNSGNTGGGSVIVTAGNTKLINEMYY